MPGPGEDSPARCGSAQEKRSERTKYTPLPSYKQRTAARLKSLVGGDAVFVAQSNPQKVQVSEPRHELRGLGWTACVKAELTSANGKPLGEKTYRISISSGVIIDRQRVEGEDTCATETYQPI